MSASGDAGRAQARVRFASGRATGLGEFVLLLRGELRPCERLRPLRPALRGLTCICCTGRFSSLISYCPSFKSFNAIAPMSRRAFETGESLSAEEGRR